MKLRFGLAANRLHHETADAALFTWLRTSGAGIRELGMQLHTVGRTHDAIMLEGMLQGAIRDWFAIPMGAKAAS
jgi:hypothetical protein